MSIQHPARTIILIGIQSLATARFQPVLPDRALQWLETGTLFAFDM